MHKYELLVQPKLQDLGLSWADDVEDVYPIVLPAMNVFAKGMPNPHKRIYTSSTADPNRLYEALVSSLKVWSIHRTIAVDSENGTSLLVVLRLSKRYLDQAITSNVEVEDYQTLIDEPMPGNHTKGELPRGPMFRAVIAKVAKHNTTALLVMVNHAVMDGNSMILWQKDVAAHLSLGQIAPKVSHRLFSDIYHQYSKSSSAQDTVNFHLQRLRGIGALGNASWPPSNKLPSATGRFERILSPNENTVTGGIQQSEATKASPKTILQCTEIRRYTSLPRLRGEFGVSAPAVAKAAVAIFNCIQTNQNCALMSLLLSGRTWPFLHESLAKFLPSPKNIAGPTLSMAVDVVNVDWGESVIDMLKRLEQDQRELGHHQHIPIADLVAQMDPQDLPWWQATFRQFFNWLPFGGHAHAPDAQLSDTAVFDPTLKLISDESYRVDEMMQGCTWEPRLVDSDRMLFQLKISPLGFSQRETASIVSSALDIVEFLCEPRNWAKDVGEVKSACVPDIGSQRHGGAKL